MNHDTDGRIRSLAIPLVTLDDVEAARRLLEPVVRRTPVERSEHLSNLAGRPLLLKAEHLQRTGSFKIRGAYHRIARLELAERAAGVVAASAGNHAQGVALAASLLGVRSTIFMPATAPFPKVAATRGYGAEVVLGGVVFDDALTDALAYAERSGATFVSPFNDPVVIAGQGTIGLELADQAAEAETVVVSVGGGGLISGVAVALKALRPGIRIVGVEAEGAASMTASLAAGRTVTLDRIDTMADGIAVKRVSDLTLAHVTALVDELVTVSEEDLSRALLLLLERAKTVVEPAGAAPLAAALAGKLPGDPGRPACLILSGGNIDPTLLIRVIRHGLTAAGRYLLLRIALADRPGELHRLTGVLAELGVNVVDIEHHRSGVHLAVGEVEVHMTTETRDPNEHEHVLSALRAAGYRAEVR
ncbi:MAG TPA: threonine ammonia-lyase [Acidimicrobiia bacterium]|nr:threonine ammonia-lyase [Acidimicrobiia bacterium]